MLGMQQEIQSKCSLKVNCRFSQQILIQQRCHLDTSRMNQYGKMLLTLNDIMIYKIDLISVKINF